MLNFQVFLSSHWPFLRSRELIVRAKLSFHFLGLSRFLRFGGTHRIIVFDGLLSAILCACPYHINCCLSMYMVTEPFTHLLTYYIIVDSFLSGYPQCSFRHIDRPPNFFCSVSLPVLLVVKTPNCLPGCLSYSFFICLSSFPVRSNSTPRYVYSLQISISFASSWILDDSAPIGNIHLWILRLSGCFWCY